MALTHHCEGVRQIKLLLITTIIIRLSGFPLALFDLTFCLEAGAKRHVHRVSVLLAYQ